MKAIIKMHLAVKILKDSGSARCHLNGLESSLLLTKWFTSLASTFTIVMLQIDKTYFLNVLF